MRSDKAKKEQSTQQRAKRAAESKTARTSNQVLSLFCAPASGSTAINYLAQDPELAEKEAAAIFEATRKSKK